MAMPVTVAMAQTKDVPLYLDEIGRTVASESVMISPQVSGKIMTREFEDGAEIKKDQLLFKIDQQPFQATLDQAKGSLAQAKASVDYARQDFQFVEKLQGTNAVSQETYEQKKNQVAVNEAQVQSAEAAVQAAQINLDYCLIRSPIAGRAGHRLVDVGNVINGAGQMQGTALLAIQKVSPIYVDFTVNEGELARVRQYMAGGTLVVQARLPQDAGFSTEAMTPTTQPSVPPGQDVKPEAMSVPSTMPVMPTTAPVATGPRAGKLIFLDNAVQDGTGTVKLRAEFPNDDGYFWPGQFVSVRLVLQVAKGAVLVPNEATQISQMGLFVYLAAPGPGGMTVAAVQPVTVGQMQGDQVVVTTGLKGGEKVIVTGQTILFPGVPVAIQTGGPPGGPPGMPPADAKPPTADAAKNDAAHTDGGKS